MTDVQIAVSKVCKPHFIKEAMNTDLSLIGTIVSELGSNIIKYAGRGSIKISKISQKEALDIEILAQDQGPGIANIDLALKDHFTTGNTLGLGLPGVKRMSDDFSIQSEVGFGTSVYARKRIYSQRDNAILINSSGAKKDSICVTSAPSFEVGLCNRPITGGYVSGDTVLTVEFDRFILLSVVDVSGHGEKAHDLSQIISDYIRKFPSEDLINLMTEIHKILVGSLGAAIGLLLIDIELQAFRYLGVGNTGANRLVGDPWKGISRDGVIGQRLPGLYPQAGFLKNGDIFCMWSDGISDHTCGNFVKNNGYKPAQVIANNLVNESGKQHDDASCIIFKWLA